MEFFYGMSRTFSTKNNAQYEAIGAFWDEMSETYGLENLRGVGYGWTEDTIEYAIGLKDDMLDDYDCEICFPEENWHTVKGRTEELGKLYDEIYREGRLDMEIETFTEDGECEISYYRMTDEWKKEIIHVRDLVAFGAERCSAYLRLNEPEKIDMVSNFMYTKNSSVHWFDEASYGMCTHHCTKEEAAEVLELLKRSDVKQWQYTLDLRSIPVTKEVKDLVIRILEDSLRN